jgi:hypothetical protein
MAGPLVDNVAWACCGQFQARESSDNPMLNAFCRVAPSVRFSVRAIFAAGVFLRAIVFSSRTCADVQARLFFDPFFITNLFSGYKGQVLVAGNQTKEKPCAYAGAAWGRGLAQKTQCAMNW